MPQKQGEGKIGYLHYTVSPVKGKCLNLVNHAECDQYCYMGTFFQRFEHSKMPMNPEIRLDMKELLWSPKEPSRIGVCFNLDLFHPDLNHDGWITMQIEHAYKHPEHTWVYLTKFPERYRQFYFPTNCWLGTTVDGLPHTQDNVYKLLSSTKPTHIRFGSFEPVLKHPNITWILPIIEGQDYPSSIFGRIDWIIIGRDTSPGAKKIPKVWVDTLVQPANEMNIPIWMKDSLSYMDYMIKELPSQIEIKVIREPTEPVLFKDEFPTAPCGHRITFPNEPKPPLT